MCIVCQHPERDNYAGANPKTVSCLLPIEAKQQRDNYEIARLRIVELGESNWLCLNHLENYRQVVEALEVYSKARWGN